MANAVSVFNLDNITVRQQGDLFSLGDLHTASGGEEKHKSSNFLRLDTTQALIAEMAKGSDVSLFLQPVASLADFFPFRVLYPSPSRPKLKS